MPRWSRATRKKCATRRTRGLVLFPVSPGGSSHFLWKRCVVFQQMKNNFYLPCQFFENRRSMPMLIDLTEHFIVKQKSILKHQKYGTYQKKLNSNISLYVWVVAKLFILWTRIPSTKNLNSYSFHIRTEFCPIISDMSCLPLKLLIFCLFYKMYLMAVFWKTLEISKSTICDKHTWIESKELMLSNDNIPVR